MVEPTRVPLQPIRKGSLTKLWAGIIVVLLVAAGAAWLNVPHAKKLAGGVTIETLEAGHGPSPTTTDIALINYKGMLGSGKMFDQGQGVPMPVTGVVPGFSTALQAMQAGGKYRIRIPAAQAYGAEEKRNQQTGEVEGVEPLRTLKEYRWDRELRGILFGQNAITVGGVGERLQVGDSFEVTWK